MFAQLFEFEYGVLLKLLRLNFAPIKMYVTFSQLMAPKCDKIISHK